jgi:nucleoside diphosphate kinase
MPIQRTLVLLKPDTVRRGLVGNVLSRFESKGLSLVALDLRTIDGRRPTSTTPSTSTRTSTRRCATS